MRFFFFAFAVWVVGGGGRFTDGFYSSIAGLAIAIV